MLFDWLPASIWRYLVVAAGAVLLLVIAYASLVERFRIEECRVRIVLDRLPRAFSGMRIALLSDIHLGAFYGPRRLSKVVDLINRSQPDIICLVGDLTSGRIAWGYRKAVPELSRMRARLRKLAVLGNNDYAQGPDQVKSTLELGGFQVLVNDCFPVGEGNERLFLAGLDDVIEGEPKPERVMRKVPDGACRILLVHEPDYSEYLQPRFDIDLQLSGHSHGGQFCLPGIGPIITTKMGRKYLSGLYRLGGMQIYTTRGIGTTLLPMRLFCRPEVSLLVLEALE
ncbi:MAG: metallophosphoesterase [Firmicutes bacterium]|nr:metallophosphoesterase [Bacillota bacterium]